MSPLAFGLHVSWLAKNFHGRNGAVATERRQQQRLLAAGILELGLGLAYAGLVALQNVWQAFAIIEIVPWHEIQLTFMQMKLRDCSRFVRFDREKAKH